MDEWNPGPLVSETAALTVHCQCDKMLVYSFNNYPFTTMNFCPKAHKICQSIFTILPNTEFTFKKLPKTYKIAKDS